MADETQRAVDLYGGAVALVPGGVTVRDAGQAPVRGHRSAGLAGRVRRPARRARPRAGCSGSWVRSPARGPASIHGLYQARGRGEVGGFTVPAINVRMMAYDTARAIFRAARAGKAGAIILEIARSEIAYTEQRPAEYVAVLIARGAARGLRPAALHSGRPLPGQPEEVPGRSRGRGRRGEEAHRRGDRRRLLQHRRRHLDAGGPVAADARRAAAAQLRARRRDHRASSGSTSPRASPSRSAPRSAKSA